nr:PREDICTED: putative uncharacterized protein DDB_G0282133 [Linepithema humile]
MFPLLGKNYMIDVQNTGRKIFFYIGSLESGVLHLSHMRDTSKSRKSESRSSIGSSILKSHKPRQALQSVDFDSSLDENSPTTVSPKLKRRVSFAEKKHVKQFCHLTDQGLTVWDSTYEEHDISPKGFNDIKEGSVILNEKSQPGKIKILNISDVSHVSRSTTLSNNIVSYRNSDGKENCVSDIGEKYSESCFNNIESELDKTCIKDVSMEFTTAIPTSLAISSIKEHVVKNRNMSLNNSSTNCCNVSMEITEALPGSMASTSCNLGIFEQTSTMVPNYKNAKHDITNNIHENTIFPINDVSHVSRSTTLSNNIVSYSNSDGKENCVSDIGEKYSESCFNNIESELDKTCIKDVSMEFTTAIPTSLAISSIKEHVVENRDISLNNLFTNCCNVSMEITEALPGSMASTSCNLGIFEQISTMVPNYKNAKHDITNNIHENTIFPINAKSNILSKSIVFDRKQDANYANDSMALTTVIQSTNTDTCYTNDIAFNTSMEMTDIASKMYENDISHSYNKSAKCSTVNNVHDSTINTQFSIAEQKKDANYTNNSMVLTTMIQPTNTVVCHNTTFDTSMEITAAVTSKIYAGDIRHCCSESIVERNDLKNVDTDETEFFNDVSIEMTRPVNICTPSSYNKENLRMVESRSRNDKTALFLNTSMEMTEVVSSRNREVNLVACKLISDKNTQAEKDISTEFIVKNTTDFQSNLEDSINDISECNFLTNSLSYLKDSSAELESIEPPLFVCLDSEEENSFHSLHQDKPQTLRIADDALVNNSYNNSDQSTNSKREFVDLETEALTNNQNNQAKDYYESITANKTENNQEVDCHVIKKARIEKGKCSRQKYLNKSMEVKQYIDTLDKTEVIIKEKLIKEKLIKHIEKYCKESSNAVQIMEREEECIEKRPEAEQSVGLIKDEFVINQDWFLSLFQKLEIHGNSDYCIWNVYHKNIDRRIITFGFMANSLLIVMYLSNCTEEILKIQKISIISRVTDDSGVLIKIVHKLILEKLNAETLMDFCKTQEDILPMLDFVSQDITLVMDFMFDLKRLNSLNLMEISTDEITFISRSKHMDIVLKITIKVKCFNKLTSNDIDVHCLLGTVREKQVRNLITNVKKDCKFLTRYMNDVKNYLDIVEDTFK